ncbi:hypothetical protein Sjap_025684 [Stephania japonica]|uniref:Uncharacterized protein n=1 Tax=Stephania japonica TaxID=461633 RepID=A0AAP0HEE6_9MAGN
MDEASTATKFGEVMVSTPAEPVSLGALLRSRSRWSPFLRPVVLPGLAVSLRSLRLVAPVSFIADISRSLSVSIRIRLARNLWDDALPEDLVRAAYDSLRSTRYTALMHKLKKNRVQPIYVTDEAWRRYLQYWESEDFQARSRQATQNRNTEVEGPGTGPSKHGGGSVSFATTQERLGERRGDTELPGASTSQTPDVVPRAEFDVVAEQLRKVMNFMHQHLGMDMDEIGLAQQQPPPPPPPPPPHD